MWGAFTGTAGVIVEFPYKMNGFANLFPHVSHVDSLYAIHDSPDHIEHPSKASAVLLSLRLTYVLYSVFTEH